MKLFKSVQTNAWYSIELLVLDGNTWNNLTVCKQMSSDSFRNNITYKIFIYKLYIYISKEYELGMIQFEKI